MKTLTRIAVLASATALTLGMAGCSARDTGSASTDESGAASESGAAASGEVSVGIAMPQ